MGLEAGSTEDGLVAETPGNDDFEGFKEMKAGVEGGESILRKERGEREKRGERRKVRK